LLISTLSGNCKPMITFEEVILKISLTKLFVFLFLQIFFFAFFVSVNWHTFVT